MNLRDLFLNKIATILGVSSSSILNVHIEDVWKRGEDGRGMPYVANVPVISVVSSSPSGLPTWEAIPTDWEIPREASILDAVEWLSRQ